VIRIFVPFSRTLYFNDKGRERGLTAENALDLEQYLNKKYKAKLGKRPLTVVLVPTTRDRLLSDVVEGRADIAAGDLTVTEDRLKLVDMIAPEGGPQVREVLLTGRNRGRSRGSTTSPARLCTFVAPLPTMRVSSLSTSASAAKARTR
jgi:membrane-bound lytic murein transglycosylase MltF